MKILALETATLAGSVALADDEEGLIGEVRVNVKIAHAERLMPAIDWLLKASGISIHDIDAFALSIGPGSFTGLRIGLSTAKGFAFATNKPLVPVPTLNAFARSIPFSRHLLCPMLDARKHQVYAGLYRWEGGVCTKVMPETTVRPDEFLQKIHEPTVFMGDGCIPYKDMISEILKSNALFAPLSRMSPSASAVAEIAMEEIKGGFSSDPVGIVPYYIRKSEAEVNWKG